MNRTCDNCGRTTDENEQMFSMKIEMFARAEPVILDPAELAEDHLAKMEQLVREMENLDPEEASDEVYEAYSFDLCGRCRRQMHRELKLKAKQKR